MKIINLGILAHVDAGKTTLTESLLYTSGAIAEPGSVDKGTTRTDTMNLERQRGITIQTAVTSFQWEDVKVNIIDTPGHMDFLAEVYRSLSVLDGAVLLVSAKDGIQAQTRILFHALQIMKIPTIFFINKIDQEGHFLCLVSAKFSMGVASFIVQYRITKLLKSTLFVKLPAIRFHILTSFLVGKLVVLPPFSRGNTAFFKNAEDFLKFLQKFFERTKCARPKSPDGRIGIVSSIQMIRQFIYISVVSPGGGRAFFDKSITVGFCRYAFCFMAATSFSRRFQQ